MPRFVSKETEKKWILRVIEEHESGKSVRLAICTTDEDKIIGFINLLNIDFQNKTCETSIIIGEREYHRKGIAAEARVMLFKYAFFELGMERIQSRIFDTNKAAILNAEKFGYTKEGILRKAIFRNGEFQDVHLYSMLREEFIEKFMTK
jgi:RimJ/RimL family protein N-acetyltransferase